MYEICILTAFLSQADSQYWQCLSLLLRSHACGSERGNFWYRNLLQLLWKRVHRKEDRWMVITQLQFQGLLGSPGKSFPLSSGGVASVCRINAKMDLHRKVEQLIPFLDCLRRGSVLLFCHSWINFSVDPLVPLMMLATYLPSWCF